MVQYFIDWAKGEEQWGKLFFVFRQYFVNKLLISMGEDEDAFSRKCSAWYLNSACEWYQLDKANVLRAL